MCQHKKKNCFACKISDRQIVMADLNCVGQWPGGEGTLICKLHWYPKLYILFIIAKTLFTFIMS